MALAVENHQKSEQEILEAIALLRDHVQRLAPHHRLNGSLHVAIMALESRQPDGMQPSAIGLGFQDSQLTFDAIRWAESGSPQFSALLELIADEQEQRRVRTEHAIAAEAHILQALGIA